MPDAFAFEPAPAWSWAAERVALKSRSAIDPATLPSRVTLRRGLMIRPRELVTHAGLQRPETCVGDQSALLGDADLDDPSSLRTLARRYLAPLVEVAPG